MSGVQEKKQKIAFVSVRYGVDINGGAEQHCRMIAERITERYAVEVLTTCVKDYTKGINEYSEGEYVINGVLVRRFNADPFDIEKDRYWAKKAKPSRRFRMFLHKIGILRPLTYVIKNWRWELDNDIKAQRYSMFYSRELLDFLSSHKDDYKAVVAFSSNYPLFYFTSEIAGDKMLAIPTLHNMKVSFRVTLAKAFKQINYIGFNTEAEFLLARSIFGAGLGRSSVISAGIEVPEPADWEETKRLFSLPDQYILYIGRVDKDKSGKMFSYYECYKRKYKDRALPLVVAGKVYDNSMIVAGVLYLGFVNDAQKRVILQHAKLMLNPSLYESLSLVLIEALYDYVPALLNGHCAVFREHQKKSGGAVQCYTGKFDFVRKLYRITTDFRLRETMKEKGKAYVSANYSWGLIMNRLYKVIDTIG